MPPPAVGFFWHNVWKECESPRNAAVADVMPRARAEYHRAVRYVKKNKDDIRKDNMANAISSNRKRDFWKEVKKVR